MGIALIIVLLYLLVMLYVGWWCQKREIKGLDDYLVAGRRLGPVILAGTLAATQVGGGSTMGVAQRAYGDWGLSAAWYIITMAIAYALLAFIAPYFRRTRERTVPEYFRSRYGEANSVVASIMLLPPVLGDAAVQIIASATLLSVMLGWSYAVSAIVAALVIIAYCYMGGMWSTAITDVIQWGLIVVGLAVAIPFGLRFVGGWNNVVANLPTEKFSLLGGMGFGTALSLVVMYVTAFTVGQETIQRYYAAYDEGTVKKGSLLTSAFYIVFAYVPTVLGLIMLAAVNMKLVDPTFLMSHGARYALPVLAVSALPPLVTGLLAAGLLGATMSSADSDILGCASIWTNDVYSRYFRKDMTDEQKLRHARGAVLVFGMLALGIALMNLQNIIGALVFFFSLKAAGTFFPYALGHFWKKASPAGSLLSIVSGSVVVVLFQSFGWSFFGMDPIIPGLLVAFVFFLFGSLLIPGKQTTT